MFAPKLHHSTHERGFSALQALVRPVAAGRLVEQVRADNLAAVRNGSGKQESDLGDELLDPSGSHRGEATSG
jgi:hypothetical protein